MLYTRSLLLASFVTLACSNTPTPGSPVAPVEPDAVVPAKPMLPAYPLPGERGAGKADQFSDYKNANQAVYGITAAPAEPMRAVSQWDDHEAILLGWTGNFPDVYASIVKASKPVATVWVVHEGSQQKSSFLQAMANYGVSTSGITFVNSNLDSIWMRDYGPFGVRAPDGRVAFVDPRYYDQRVFDDAIPTVLASQFGINSYRQPLKWEGGTFMADGRGNCFHSQGVLWYGGTTEAKITQYLRDYMGCETVTVLYPLNDEGTTHSDMFAKLLPGDRMLLGDYQNWQDSGNAQVLDANAALLQATTLNDGKKLAVTRLPMPSNSNRQIWRTYANSLFINGKNLVPVYTDDTQFEDEALGVWESVMPDWEHVPIDSTDLITWSGAIHCITMTVPSGVFEKSTVTPANICNGAFECFPTATQAETCSLVFEGCCDGDAVRLCSEAGPVTALCGGKGCGYSEATRAYACGGSGAGPANAPLVCGAACAPSCAGKSCGSDGCGGSCGTCSGSQTCSDGVCKAPADPCGGITYTGCCDGKNLKWCENSQVQTQSCGQVCGWNQNQGFYDCGWSGTDPTGANPKACPAACTPNCSGKTCGDDGCGGSCGSCPSGQSCSASGQCACTPNCGGKTCGANGCGGTCGACAAGQTCTAAGQCVAACTPSCAGKQCGPNGCGGICGTCAAGLTCSAAGQCAAQGCGTISAAGQCAGSVLSWCENATLQVKDCSSLGNFTCGAVPNSSPADFDCLAAQGCTPACGGKTCGADGCGGVCGWCAASEACVSGTCVGNDPCQGLTWQGCCDGGVLNWCQSGEKQSQSCGNSGCGWNVNNQYYDCGWVGDGPAEHPLTCGGTACVPSCAGKSCGSDGCGGVCGVCTGGLTCQDGACVSACGNISFDGACVGTQLVYCDGGQLYGGDCAQVPGADCCGFDAEQGYYSCLAGAACGACQPECAPGDSGCSVEGSHSWVCGLVDGCERRVYTSCALGCDTATSACVPDSSCAPSCAGKACGSDGCGGTCGACASGSSCNADGACVAACTGSCDGKTCGSDGCGGSCGTCASGEACVKGICVPGQCNPKCQGKVCGDDGCGGSCGACAAGKDCDKTGQCVDPGSCTPDCGGRACGPDGCGDVCGVCAKAEICQDGACSPDPTAACGEIPKIGVCDGNVLRFCDDAGTIAEIDCEKQGLVCQSTRAVADCVTAGSCLADCTGKVCGDDGCGGSCGSCSKGDACTGGQCVVDTCAPACDGKSCGDDGCGGTCACADGAACEAGQCEGADGADGTADTIDGFTGGGSSGDGCSSRGAAPASPLWFALALGVLAVSRRSRAQPGGEGRFSGVPGRATQPTADERRASPPIRR